tara:strand:- start:790 stop:1347 length:558 start_codon:yes stop_codon:yes gene_type:complete
MAQDEDIIIEEENVNPTIVKVAQEEVGVAFDGDEVGGKEPLEEFGVFKPNAKLPIRQDLTLYNAETMNVPLEDKDPFSPEIKAKNDSARLRIIPLLNPINETQGKRNQSIQAELLRELAKEEAKPEPDPQIIKSIKTQVESTNSQRFIGKIAREGIQFKEQPQVIPVPIAQIPNDDAIAEVEKEE